MLQKTMEIPFMRKLWIILRTSTILYMTPAISQEIQIVDDQVAEDIPITSLPGEASASAAYVAQSSGWQTWAIAGGAILAAAIGIVLVATNSGSAVEHE